MKLRPEYVYIGILVISLIANLFFFSYGVKGDKCISDPFTFGANKVDNEFKDTGGIFCRCSFSSPRYGGFYFTKEGLVQDTLITKNVSDSFAK